MSGRDVEWQEHARATRPPQRERLVASALAEVESPQAFAEAFLRPPRLSA